MHLHVSIFLVCILLIGGDSLECYICSYNGSCNQQECKDQEASCAAMVSKSSGSQKRSVANRHSVYCVTGFAKTPNGYKVKTKQDQDLCYSEDGIYKGSFLLCPLISYFLFH